MYLNQASYFDKKEKKKIKHDVNFIHEYGIIFELYLSDENKLKFELDSTAWFICEKKKN